jgi:3-oxoacyl-[acyl-carrier protein] reductase
MTSDQPDLAPGKPSGRAVLITGASRGIGRAIAASFAQAGDRVAIHHRGSPELAQELAASLPGGGHVVVQADLADGAATRVMVDRAAEQLGGLDVLVNNAGVFTAHPVTEVSYEDWQEQWAATIATNLTGAANVIWCAVQHLTQPGGRIVNVSSRGAFRGEPESPAYGASKAGLNSLGQSLAIALAPRGIAVSTVAPGFVATDMTNEHLKPPRGDEIRSQSPFGRVAEPDEIAAAVLYLASAQAEWASGAVLDLNGASYLRT